MIADTIEYVLSADDSDAQFKLSNLGQSFLALGKSAMSALGDITKSIGNMIVTGGMDRALAIQDSERMLHVMIDEMDEFGNVTEASMSQFKAITDATQESVNDTQYALGDMSKVSANLYASGIHDTELFQDALNAVADVAQMTGRDLDSIGTIFSKVGATGKLSGQELLQLSQAGLPATQMLADSMGVTAEEARAMVTAGKVSFNDLVNAIEGDTSKIAGMAKGMGESWDASIANLKSALSRLGAVFMDDFTKDMVEPINELKNIIKEIANALRDGTEVNMESVMTALDNITSGISNAMDNLIANVGKVLNVALPVISKLIETVATMLPNMVRKAIPVIMNVITEIVPALISAVEILLPEIFNIGAEILNSISEGITDDFPSMVSSFLDNLDGFIDSFLDGLDNFVDAGINLIMALADGLVEALPALIEKVPLLITKLCEGITENIQDIVMAGLEIIINLAKGLIDNLPVILENMGNIIHAVLAVIEMIDWINVGKNLITLITDGIKALWEWIPKAIKDIGSKAVEWLKNIDWFMLGENIIDFIMDGIVWLKEDLPSKLLEIGNNALNKIKEIDWIQTGKDIINGIIDGIKALGGSIASTLKGFAEDAWNGVKNFFGISSPSKLMRDTVGKMIPLGMAKGIEDESITVKHAMDDMSDLAIPDVDGLTSNLATGVSINNVFNDNNIVALLETYLPEIASQKEVVIGEDALVSGLTGGLNRSLGMIYNGEI